MTVYSYIKPQWRNGPHAVSDAPNWVVGTIDRALSHRLSRQADELIQLEHDAEVGLTMAWIQCSVSLEVADESASYRRAKYVHALAVVDGEDSELTRELAQQLLEGVYGRPIVDGIAAREESLRQLDHPTGMDAVRDLLLDREQIQRVVAPAACVAPPLVAAPPSSLSGLLTYRGPEPPATVTEKSAPAPLVDHGQAGIPEPLRAEHLAVSPEPAAAEQRGDRPGPAIHAWALALALLVLGTAAGALGSRLLALERVAELHPVIASSSSAVLPFFESSRVSDEKVTRLPELPR